ncbi:MAG: alpha/beta fold hydrolase [Candidatus Binatia bacterium]
MQKPDWLTTLFPWEQHLITVNGRRMAYIDEGSRTGRPVLLLSGNPTWGFLYRDFVAPLTTLGYRAIAPDWIGCGYSDHPRVDAGLTFAHHIADLVSLIDQLDLSGFVIVGQDWGGPQGAGAALQRRDRLSALVLMSTWLFTGQVGRFHSSPRPWTTWHAPLIGQYFMKRHKVLSHGGPPVISKRKMTEPEARAYHHVFDEPDSDHVVLTWPRTIPMREGDRGWADMVAIQQQLPELASTPTLLLYATQDSVFGKPYADRLKQLLPHAEGPLPIEGADHFLQDDRGPEVAATIVPFLQRTLGPAVSPAARRSGKPMHARPVERWTLEFFTPGRGETEALRPDPLLIEQELDVRPDVADALERATGLRAGRIYWRSARGYLYALELADVGRGRPSMATVYGFWPRWEPRPPEEEIDRDLLDFCLWVATIAPGIDPTDVIRVAEHAGITPA